MRRGYKPEVVLDNNNFVGFFTSADFCAEHECGTGKLRALLGCVDSSPREPDCKIFGIKTRMIDPKVFAANSVFHKQSTWAVLIIQPKWLLQDRKYDKPENWPRDLDKPTKERPISAAWSEESLGIAVHKEHIKRLEALHLAILEGHGCLLFSKQMPVFDNGGQILADVRMVRKDYIMKMEDADRSVFELYKEHRAIGIEERLRKHNKEQEAKGFKRWSSNWHNPYIRLDDGTEINKENYNPLCEWMALSPRWNDNGSRFKTAYKVIYWLNTEDQQQNNCAWVTVEDLEDWMQGKGAIPGRGMGWSKYLDKQSDKKHR